MPLPVTKDVGVAMAAMTAREFNQDTARATRLASAEPVFVSKRGQVTYVLLSIDEYNKLAGRGPRQSILDLLFMEEAEGIEFDIPRLSLPPRGVDLD
jgi:hypothetical protein